MAEKSVILGVAAALILGGCGKGETGRDELQILCGNSFAEPCRELVELFTAETGIRASTSVAGSEDFLPLVKTGQRGDILITHDPYLDFVKEAGALHDHVQTGFVAPVLAVQKGNPKGIRRIEDLAAPGLKVALTDPQYSTCGEMVFKLLEKKGIKEAVLENVGNRLTKGHSNLGTFLKTGAVDAVILWNGVAYNFKGDLEVIPTPYEYDTEVRVHVIGLGYSKRLEWVERFVNFTGARGPAIFLRYGYVK